MVSKVLALLAQSQGFEVKQSEVHGMAKRGGSVFSHVRFGRQVWSPTIPKGEVDILVALEWAEGLRWLPFLKPGAGIFICDTKRIVPPFACLNRHPGAPLRYSKETPAEVIAHVAEGYAIDATAHGRSNSATNARPTSSCSARCPTALDFSVADWERTVAEFVPKKTIAVNLEAFRRGRDWIEEARNATPPVEAPVTQDAGAGRYGLPRASRNQSGMVQELRYLREDVPGALPAPECGPHRGAGRAGQVHRLPAVRMAVPGFRDPGASRCRRRRARGIRPMNAVDPALTGKNAVKLISGNHACALGAIAAGCRFFAGYPITPSSEIAERLARHLPEVDGVFVQMEDEIASMAAVIGASMGGVKAMTATSGPGFSLKQENLGYAAGAEIPCVIVNVMRGGPSTGMPTRPSQADMMQARWGSHGDYPIIVLTPASVGEIYSETIRAFELAELCRSPVVLLYDQVIAQLSETVALNGAPRPNRRTQMGERAARRLQALWRRTTFPPWPGPATATACTPPG